MLSVYSSWWLLSVRKLICAKTRKKKIQYIYDRSKNSVNLLKKINANESNLNFCCQIKIIWNGGRIMTSSKNIITSKLEQAKESHKF